MAVRSEGSPRVRQSGRVGAGMLRLARGVPLGLLLLAALVPRVLDLGGFLTIDEANFWLRRSEIFLEALQRGDYGATALSAHPGVTTMWLGSGGIVLRRALAAWSIVDDPTFATRLALMRLPVVLTHVAAIMIGFMLLRRLFGPGTALLAALLWALDPFLVGYSRLLHVDALAASLATLSLLAAIQRPTSSIQMLKMLALSGFFAGLAVLSKLPALAVGPVIALGAFWWAAAQQDQRRALRLALGGLLLWSAVLVLTVFALWPALWVDPLAAYRALREAVEVEGGQPHLLGNFFLGREVASPGPLFYPVALALRASPLLLLGLGALALCWRRVAPEQRRALALLAAFVVLFVAALTLFPKKFNRYALPAFPPLAILAAAGLHALFSLWPPAAGRRVASWLLPAAVLLLAAAQLAAVHPYAIAAFNPLLGGTAAGARTFVVGWGEGYEQAAAWLNQQADITGVVTVSAMTPTLQPYLRPGAQAVPPSEPLPANAGYVVVTIEQVQRGNVLPPFDRFYGHATPLHTFEVGGIPYGWIYAAPPVVATERHASFGEAIALRGFAAGPLRAGQPLALQLFWEAKSKPAGTYLLFVHLIGPDGQRYAQADLPPDAGMPTAGWLAGSYPLSRLDLSLPAALPAGSYQLVVGLYDQATGMRLPLGAAAAEEQLDGRDALVLARLTREEP